MSRRDAGVRSPLVAPTIIMLVGILALIDCLVAGETAPAWLTRGSALVTIAGAALELLVMHELYAAARTPHHPHYPAFATFSTGCPRFG